MAFNHKDAHFVQPSGFRNVRNPPSFVDFSCSSRRPATCVIQTQQVATFVWCCEFFLSFIENLSYGDVGCGSNELFLIAISSLL